MLAHPVDQFLCLAEIGRQFFDLLVTPFQLGF
jgi:hypothetical protein